MASTTTSFINLPDEIHLRILHFAGWRSALSLSSTSRRFLGLSEEPTFWHAAVNESFRMHLDNFDKESGDWKGAFRKLVTGRFYAWGQIARMRGDKFNRIRRDQRNAHQPLHLGDEIEETVVDVQCGGWCYSLLTLAGNIVMIGSLDNSWAVMTTRSIKFPAPGVKVYQHSAGRQHLIVLSERGEVWYVSGANSEVPVLCSFAELDIVLGYPGDTQRRPGTVSKVVAGWNVSGALVEGYGIAVWFGTQPGDGGQFHVKDAPFLSRLNAMEDADAVVDFAIGENYLMAVTASGKVYAANIEDIEQEELIAPMEMLNFEAPAGHPPINRVVGWFRKFALFNKDGLVHIVDDSKDLKVSRQLLYGDDASHGLSGALEEMRTDAVTPTEVPGLKEYTIVDVAFGDWHCLALTDTGKVLSWGRESGLCGCLGLGRPDVAEQKGLRINNGYDGDLDTAQVVTFEHPYSENEEQGDGTTEYAYKIAAAGWHSCALVAMVEKGSTLSAGGISKPLALDGSGDSKPPDETPKPPGPKSPQPPTEKGHRGGIEGVPSDARGGRVSLAEASIARAGGNSIFGLGTSAKQIPPPPPTEHGHRGGIVGVQSDARGGNSSLAEGSMARGGQSFFGMTGGALQLGEGDRLSESRETEKEKAKKRKLEQ